MKYKNMTFRMMKPVFLVVALVGMLSGCASTTEEVRPVSVEPATTETPPQPEVEQPLPEPFLAEQQAAKEAAEREESRRRRKVASEEDEDSKNIILNFENADINTVIETVGDILGINYILGPGISGSVTIQSNSKFPVEDLFSVFQAVLEMNNLTAVREGHFYTILPVDQAKGLPLGVGKGKDVEKQLDSQFVTQIVVVENVKAADAAGILRNLLPRGADLVVYEPTNLLIITARPNALRRLMKILEAVDVAETESEGVRTFVYYVEHGEAKSLVEILKQIFTESEGGTRAATPAATTSRAAQLAAARRRAAAARRTPAKTPTTPESPTPTTISGETFGEVVITAYEDINAIIVKCTPKEYLSIVDALKKLDTPRRQVLIDVMVAEVTLTDKEEFGLEWLLKDAAKVGGRVVDVQGGVFQSGITGVDAFAPFVTPAGATAAVLDAGRFSALIRLYAQRNQLKVLASPTILATDTKEARIEVGQEVPTATGSVTTGEAVDTGVTTVGQIQYRTTGTILEVTPQINARNMVTLKLSQEISNVVELETGSTVGNSPLFSTRKAKTTAIVEDGQTLVIGGLISETTNRSHGGVPFLSDIPLLGYLFGKTINSDDRTELLIMVTPHIVTGSEESKAITEEYRDRVRLIRERIEDF